MDGIKEGSRIAVGSLPGQDAIAAVKTQLAAFPEMPAWPQLPQRSPKEKMTVQGLAGLPGLTWPSPDQALWTIPSTDHSEVLEQLKGENQDGRLDRAALKPEEAAGFFAFLREKGKPGLSTALAVKGQLTGPVTLGLSIQDEGGKPLLDSKGGMEILREYLLMGARWQARQLSNLGKPVVLFLDEPGIGPKFQPEDHGLGWQDIQNWLTFILEPLQAEGILTGIHSCAAGPWDWAFGSPAEILHFDTIKYLPQLLDSAKALGSFLKGGGIMAWGMVPASSDGVVYSDPAEILLRWVDAYHELVKKGVRAEDLHGRSLLSTSCGLGNVTTAIADRALRNLGTFSSLWKASAHEGFKT